MCYFILIISFSILSFSVSAQKDGYIKIQNGKLHYRVYGKGSPILIINGGPGMNCEGFASLAKLLDARYQPILFDQRGTGSSTLERLDSSTIGMDLMLEDMETLRKSLGIKEWIVLGQSFGGMLASYYAAIYPQQIKALVLAASGGMDMELFEYVGDNISNRLGRSEKDSMNYWDKKIEEGDTTHYARYHRALGLASAYVYDKKNIPVIAERLTQGSYKVNSLVYKDLYKIKFDCKEKLKNYRKPALIIQGRQDIVGEAPAFKAKQVLPNSKLVFINDCVHYGWLDQKEKFMEALNDFLEKLN
jgi:proline iminopeptidase